MIKEHILVELKQFVSTVANCRGAQKNLISTQVIRSSLNLLEDLPVARDLVLEYFSLVFDISVSNYVTTIGKDQQANVAEEEYINDIQESLENLVTKGPPAWSSLIASWSLDLVGKLSDKYWPSRKLDIGAACNLWLNCGAMRCLLGLIASCFRKLTNTEAEICVGTLLATFRKYSTTFDWVVARLGGCFPLKIISQILQCGLKRFSEDVRCRFDSEIGILDYLSFAHEKDLKHAIKELFEDGFNPKKPIHIEIIPYLLQLATFSEVLLQSIVAVFLDLYNETLLEAIVRQTPLWLQNSAFREMQPSLNNITLKIKSKGPKLLIITAKLCDRYSWCQDFTEYTLQELEQCILFIRTCPLINDLSHDESKSLLWKSCLSTNLIEQQTAVRLLLMASTQYPRIYHQTISELLIVSYETNKNGMGALIRILGGFAGVIDFPEVKPGLEMTLEGILLQKEFHYTERDTSCLNAIVNLISLCKLEKANSSPFLKLQPITNTLIELLPKLLNILDCVIGKLSANCDLPKTNGNDNTKDDDQGELIKRLKIEKEEESNEKTDSIQTTTCSTLAHKVICLLNCIEAGSKQHVLGMIELLKLANLTVKYFFWSLTEKSKLVRLSAVNQAFALLQRQCSARKAVRSSCLRDLIEGALFSYSHLFGGYDEPSKLEETGIEENEKLIVLNQKQGCGSNTNRSVLHAGIIGKGLKGENADQQPKKPDTEIKNFLLTALDACSQETEKDNPIDGHSTISLLLVEMVSPDVMYNGLPFPDEEFTKVTMERDLQIWRTFKTSPILWPIMGYISTHRPALCFASVLLRALCACALHKWRAQNVNKFQPPKENEELLEATQKLLQLLTMGQLLPPPLSYLHLVIEHLDAPEIALVLKDCVWNYLKDNVPSPALFQYENGVYWRNPNLSQPPPQYVDTVRNLMQRKISKLGSLYYIMFVQPALYAEEQNKAQKN